MKVTIWVKQDDIELVSKMDKYGNGLDSKNTDPIDFRLNSTAEYSDYIQCTIAYDTFVMIQAINNDSISRNSL